MTRLSRAKLDFIVKNEAGFYVDWCGITPKLKARTAVAGTRIILSSLANADTNGTSLISNTYSYQTTVKHTDVCTGIHLPLFSS